MRRKIRRGTHNSNEYVILGVPELLFIPPTDREGTNKSPEGALSCKVFKYKTKEEGRILFAQLADAYQISDLVVDKASYNTMMEKRNRRPQSKRSYAEYWELHDANKPADGRLF